MDLVHKLYDFAFSPKFFQYSSQDKIDPANLAGWLELAMTSERPGQS